MAIFKEHWLQLRPAAVLSTGVCLQQLQESGLLDTSVPTFGAAPHAVRTLGAVLAVSVENIPEALPAGPQHRRLDLDAAPSVASGDTCAFLC